MTDRDAEARGAPPARPPPLLGFAFYLLGTGCALLGLSQVLRFSMLHGVPVPSLLIRWGLPIGELMGLLGLVIAWRVTRTRHRRLIAVGATLWIVLFVLGIQRAQLRRTLAHSLASLPLATEVAPWVGWATVLGLIAFVAHVAGRTFAVRTWATTLGAALVASHAVEVAWLVLMPARHGRTTMFAIPSMEIGGAGLLLFGGGLFASGRSILRGTEGARALPTGPRGRGAEAWTPALRRGLPLLADTSVTVAGVTFALCVAVVAAHLLRSSPRDAAQLAGVGGTAVGACLLALGLYLLKVRDARPARFAMSALASVPVYLLGLYATWTTGGTFAIRLPDTLFALPGLLCASALYASATSLVAFDAGEVLAAFRARLRVAAALVASAVLALALGTYIDDAEGSLVASVVAALLAAFAFHTTIAGAGEVRRIEASLAPPAVSR